MNPANENDAMNDLVSPPRPSWNTPGYSNLDHTWDEGFEPTALTEHGAVAPHAAWNFNGRIWWEQDQFHEAVWQHHSLVAIVSRPSLQALVEAVCAEFGDD